MANRRWKLKLTLLLVSSLTIMSVLTISPAIPQMATAFSTVNHAAFLVKLVLTLPAFLIAICSPITGYLIDRFGRLRLLWFSLILYAVSGTGGYFLDNLYHILISRAILGISVGMSMTIVTTLIGDYFEGLERQKFMGLQIGVMSLGGILFIGLGGILAEYSWRYPFLMYFFSLIVLPFSVMFLNEPNITEHKSHSNQNFKIPSIIWLLFFNTMFMWIIFFLIPVQIPFHLKAIGIELKYLIGAAIATSTGFSAVSSFSYTKIKDRFSASSIFSMGYFLLSLGFFCIAVSHTYVFVIIAMMLTGLGIGMMLPNTTIWVMKIVPPEIRGKEIGKLTTFWFLGQFLSPIVIFPVLNRLSLSSTFMLAAAVLFLVSIGFLIPHFQKIQKPVASKTAA